MQRPPHIRVERLPGNPIIHAGSNRSLGGNVNGPSLIAAPSWAGAPLGRYYLYFAHHKGDHIRLAYADALTGPWRIKSGGVLGLAQSHFATAPVAKAPMAATPYPNLSPDDDPSSPHIASPDVIVDMDRRQMRM